MPRIGSVQGFTEGDHVTVIGRHPDMFRAHGQEGTVKWFYESDTVPGEQWVYVHLAHAQFYHPVADPVSGFNQRGKPCHGPFAFRASDLELIP